MAPHVRSCKEVRLPVTPGMLLPKLDFQQLQTFGIESDARDGVERLRGHVR